MSPAKGDRAAPPPPPDGWTVRHIDRDAGEGWEQLCKAHPGPMRLAYQLLAEGPHPAERTPRHHPLHYELAWRRYAGVDYEQWQYEVTGAGRVWYIVSHDQRTVWITKASVGHPKQTDKGKNFR